MPKNGFRLGVYLFFTTCWLGCLSPAMAQDLSAYVAARQAPLSPAQRRMAGAVRYAAQMAAQPQASGVHTRLARTLGLRSDGMIDVYIHVADLTATVRQTMRQYGAVLLQWHTPTGLVRAAVAPDDLEILATLPAVRWIRTPLPGTLRTGSVTSQGDVVLGVENARNTFGIDGTGVRVGIISDSLINLQSSVDTGDLPADVILLDDGSKVNPTLRTDEGRAVAEIVHDLAPGATLLFHSGFPNGLGMVGAINTLIAAGADVIVDDIGFFDEPVFEDGAVAQAVQNAVNKGVVYVTAAGNDADRHYRGRYQEFFDDDPTTQLHDFGNNNPTLPIQIRRGTTMLAVLQWPNRFNGSANTADYDLLVFDASGNTALFDPAASDGRCVQPGFSGLCASIADQTGTAPPLEIVQITNNTGADVTVTLLINRVSGEALDLDLHFNRAAVIDQELRVADHSIFGHACVSGALAVGAVDVDDARGDIEFFSSRGPCEIVFPTPQTRLKPDLVATDGVLTSPSLPGFRPFFGTSAAAPHVAAIAALLIDASGGPGVLSNTEIVDRLRQTADDLGAAGTDPVFGNGVVDALGAVTAVFSPSRGNPRSGGTGGGGGCSILPVALAPTLPVLDALGNIFLPLLVMVAIQSWRRSRSR